MSNSLNCSNCQPPSYSGVTINITNPALNIPPNVYPQNGNTQQYCDINSVGFSYPLGMVPGVYVTPNGQYPYQAYQPMSGVNVTPNGQYPYQAYQHGNGANVTPNGQYPHQAYQQGGGVNVTPNGQYPYSANSYNVLPDGQYENQITPQNSTSMAQSQTESAQSNANGNSNSEPYINKGAYLEPVHGDYNSGTQNINTTNIYQTLPGEKTNMPDTYPNEYYMNNYNKPNANSTDPNDSTQKTTAAEENVNTDVSKEIIADLDERNYAEKEQEKNSKKTKIVALTNEYIMSLENYLNNPNTDIRLMAAKEVLTRLDEDKNRYDDAALNALLNKMLQDPSKLIRIAAMSALSSELASGNDYTVQLLNQIQQNPDSDPEDVLEVSQILLKRAATIETKYIPEYNQEQQGNNEQQ